MGRSRRGGKGGKWPKVIYSSCEQHTYIQCVCMGLNKGVIQILMCMKHLRDQLHEHCSPPTLLAPDALCCEREPPGAVQE